MNAAWKAAGGFFRALPAVAMAGVLLLVRRIYWADSN